jgi:hypothetical protein
MTAQRFRKKPVEIEAMQLWADNAHEVAEWCGGKLYGHFGPDLRPILPTLTIRTLEGDMLAGRGDWIIRGVQGEFYPCRADIFEQTYEAVEE